MLSYGEGEDGVTAANDYAMALLQPVPLRALRGDELRSVQGQEQQTWRRRYNAMHSLARLVVNDIIATRTPSVTLTTAQRAQQRAQGMVETERASWAQTATQMAKKKTSRRTAPCY